MEDGSDLFGAPASAGARAPGRVNLIGEHTDYNGGLVMPAALDLELRVWLRFRTDERVRAVSDALGQVEARLDAPPAGNWLDYARGVARELARAQRIPATGFDARVQADLPPGAGLSSSAALEAAFALALLAAAGAPERKADRPELARLCQRAESSFVGTPCGLMDPYAVLCAEAGEAILLDCSSERAQPVRLPEDLALWIFDTGVAHELREGGYAQRRAECERALDQATRALGRQLDSLSSLRVEDLAPIGGRVDAVLFRRIRHVVSENARVREFAARLASADHAGAGAVLYASHDSLRVDYEVTCAESDALVADSRELPGCVGARMTGGGFGGSTLHLVENENADAFAAELCKRFEARFARTPRHWRARAARAASRL